MKTDVEKFDMIIIGAGSGCLSSALFACQKGKKVLLLEKSNRVGGYNAVHRVGRFSFEPNSRGIPSDFLGEKMSDYLLDAKLDITFTVSKNAYRIISTDGNGRDHVLPVGIDNYKKSLFGLCPECEDSFSKFLELGQIVEQGAKALSQGKSVYEVKKEFPDYVRASTYTLEEVEEVYDMPKKAREIINAYWHDFGKTPDKLDFCTYVLYFLSNIKGTFRPDLGRADIDVGLLQSIFENGGRVLLNTKVTKILVQDGKAYGVTTDDGYTYHADMIISDLSYAVLYNKFMDANEISEKTLSAVNSAKNAPDVYTICLGLNAGFEELGLLPVKTFIYPYCENDLLANALNGDGVMPLSVDLTVENGLYYAKITAVFNSNALKYFNSVDYKKQESALTQKILERVEFALKVDLRSHIEEYAVFSPVTYAKRVSTLGGSPLGLEATPFNSLINRLARENKEDRIPNVFSVGENGLLNFLGADYLTSKMIIKNVLSEQ